jgi:hypothetical protein
VAIELINDGSGPKTAPALLVITAVDLIRCLENQTLGCIQRWLNICKFDLTDSNGM